MGCPAGCETVTQLVLHWLIYLHLIFLYSHTCICPFFPQTCPVAEASGNDKKAIPHSELDDALASFRRLRNNFLVNFRNFEDLFHDRQRELAKLASKKSKDESEVLLRNLDKQELACSNIVKKMKQDLHKLGEISNEKSKLHGLLEKQVKGEEI